MTYFLKLCIICFLMNFLYCIVLPSTPIIQGDDSDDKEPTQIIFKDDSFEPNDSKNSATLFNSDSLNNLIIIPGGFDYYKITVDSNTKTTVVFKSDMVDADEYISINLCNKKSSLLKSTHNNAAPLSFFSKIQDTFFLYIFKSDAFTMSTRYSLKLITTDIYTNDLSEPNDSKINAGILNDSSTAFLSDISDTDYCKIICKPYEYMCLTVISDNANFNTVSASLIMDTIIPGKVSGDSISYYFYSKTADTCFLKINYPDSYKSSISPLKYSIKLERAVFSNDKYEPNDTKNTATLPGSGTFDSLRIIDDDNDYYRLPFDSTMLVDIVLHTSPRYLNTLNYRMSIESPRTSMCSATGNHSDSLTLSYIVNKNDSLYLRVLNNKRESPFAQSDYSLELRTTPINKIDTFEPNNTLSTATILSGLSAQSLVFGQRDTDYYKIPIQKGDYTEVTVSNDINNKSSVITKLQPPDNSFPYYKSSTNSITYYYYSSVNDTLVLEVSHPDSLSLNTQLKYAISISKAVLPEERFEPNNSKKNAARIVEGLTDSLFSNSNDADYFKYTSDTAVILHVLLKTDKPVTPAAYLYFSAGNMTDNVYYKSGLSEDTLQVDYYLAPKDTVYFGITGTYSSLYVTPSIQYSLLLSTKKVSDVDSLEPNNSRATATLINSPIQINSRIYSTNDTDYYKIPVSVGQSYTITASGSVDYNVTNYFNQVNANASPAASTAVFLFKTPVTDTLFCKVYLGSPIIINVGRDYNFSVGHTPLMEIQTTS